MCVRVSLLLSLLFVDAGYFLSFFVFTLLRKQIVRNILEQSGPVRRTNTAKSISTPHVDDTMAHTMLTFRMSRAQFAEGKERLLGPWLSKKKNEFLYKFADFPAWESQSTGRICSGTKNMSPLYLGRGCLQSEAIISFPQPLPIDTT